MSWKFWAFSSVCRFVCSCFERQRDGERHGQRRDGVRGGARGGRSQRHQHRHLHYLPHRGALPLPHSFSLKVRKNWTSKLCPTIVSDELVCRIIWYFHQKWFRFRSCWTGRNGGQSDCRTEEIIFEGVVSGDAPGGVMLWRFLANGWLCFPVSLNWEE